MTGTIAPAGDDRSDEAKKAIGLTPRSTWNFGGDKVIQATKDLAEEQRDAIRWYFYYCIENELSLTQASINIRFDKSTIFRVMTGTYGAKLDGIVEAILAFKKIAEERASITRAEFVETKTAKRIWKICESALIYNSISFIYGDSHIGKTWSLEEFTRQHDHGQTKYIRMPSSAGIQLLMKEFAGACALSKDSAFERLRDRVIKAIDKNHLVIVDEIHQTFVSYHKQARLSCLELIREIHDRTRCGMVLCGTNVFRDELQQGLHKRFLEQLRRRGIFELQLPSVPPRADLDAIAESYGLAPCEGEAEQLVLQIAKNAGLGRYCKFLEAASRHAKKKNQKLNWGHFVSAHDIIKNLSEANHERH